MQQYDTATMAHISDMNFGIRVERDAALITAASVAIFNIVTGPVVMFSLIGSVVVQIAATATLIHIDTAPAAGTVTALSTDSGDIQGFVPGRQFHLPATVAAHILSTGGAVLDVCPQWVLPVGTLNLHGSASPATGTVKWTLVYVPMDEGAHVTAA